MHARLIDDITIALSFLTSEKYREPIANAFNARRRYDETAQMFVRNYPELVTAATAQFYTEKQAQAVSSGDDGAAGIYGKALSILRENGPMPADVLHVLNTNPSATGSQGYAVDLLRETFDEQARTRTALSDELQSIGQSLPYDDVADILATLEVPRDPSTNQLGVAANMLEQAGDFSCFVGHCDDAAAKAARDKKAATIAADVFVQATLTRPVRAEQRFQIIPRFFWK